MRFTTSSLRRYRRFVDDGMGADDRLRESGRGYEAKDVHAYLEAKAKGRPAPRPKAVRWRG